MARSPRETVEARILPSFNPTCPGLGQATDGIAMGVEMVKVGIVGLGRWARVLARAAAKSDRLKIVAATSRSEDKRQAFAREFAIPAVASLEAMLADPAIAGVILTVPNEQHLPLAAQVAEDGKHVSTEKPISRQNLEKRA